MSALVFADFSNCVFRVGRLLAFRGGAELVGRAGDVREDRAEAAHAVNRLEAVLGFRHHVGGTADVGLHFGPGAAKHLGDRIGWSAGCAIACGGTAIAMMAMLQNSLLSIRGG